MAKRKSPGGWIAGEVQPVFDDIVELVDAFCREDDKARTLAEGTATLELGLRKWFKDEGVE